MGFKLLRNANQHLFVNGFRNSENRRSRKTLLQINNCIISCNGTTNYRWTNIINKIDETERFIARFMAYLIFQMFRMDEEMKNIAANTFHDKAQIEQINQIAKKYTLMSTILNDLRNIKNKYDFKSQPENLWIED